MREFDNYILLFSKIEMIVLKAPDNLLLLVKSRIADHQQRKVIRLQAMCECIHFEAQTNNPRKL